MLIFRPVGTYCPIARRKELRWTASTFILAMALLFLILKIRQGQPAPAPTLVHLLLAWIARGKEERLLNLPFGPKLYLYAVFV